MGHELVEGVVVEQTLGVRAGAVMLTETVAEALGQALAELGQLCVAGAVPVPPPRPPPAAGCVPLMLTLCVPDTVGVTLGLPVALLVTLVDPVLVKVGVRVPVAVKDADTEGQPLGEGVMEPTPAVGVTLPKEEVGVEEGVWLGEADTVELALVQVEAVETRDTVAFAEMVAVVVGLTLTVGVAVETSEAEAPEVTVAVGEAAEEALAAALAVASRGPKDTEERLVAEAAEVAVAAEEALPTGAPPDAVCSGEMELVDVGV